MYARHRRHDLHQAAGLDAGCSIRVKAALRTNEGVDQQRVEVVLGGVLLHKGGILAGIKRFFHPRPHRRQADALQDGLEPTTP